MFGYILLSIHLESLFLQVSHLQASWKTVGVESEQTTIEHSGAPRRHVNNSLRGKLHEGLFGARCRHPSLRSICISPGVQPHKCRPEEILFSSWVHVFVSFHIQQPRLVGSDLLTVPSTPCLRGLTFPRACVELMKIRCMKWFLSRLSGTVLTRGGHRKG